MNITIITSGRLYGMFGNSGHVPTVTGSEAV